MSQELEDTVAWIHKHIYSCPTCNGWTYDRTKCRQPCPAHPSAMASLTPKQKAYMKAKCDYGGDLHASKGGHRNRLIRCLIRKQCLDPETGEPTLLGWAVAGRTRI